MDKFHYDEMIKTFCYYQEKECFDNKQIYLFGHCNATEELVDLLVSKGYSPVAILDNNKEKQGKQYRGVKIQEPQSILKYSYTETIVLIVARAYAAMVSQLKRIGYKGSVKKLVDYNSFAEYSLSDETIERMKGREKRGEEKLDRLCKKFPGHFKVLCPFSALGDIYIMMSYLPYFLREKNISELVIGIIGNACGQVVKMFGDYNMEIMPQKDMDEIIQAVLFRKDTETFIPHQDRPYVVNLDKALYVKKIPLEQIYCCGVFGLSRDTLPVQPTVFSVYPNLDSIKKDRAVIFSPYAKSVTTLPSEVWEEIVADYKEKGFQCFTNVVGNEKPLTGTSPISPNIAELNSLIEYAGTFIGIRSGLCDVLRTAKAEKIALYPDYNYCDTKWKAMDIYALEGWKNILVKGDFTWKKK